MQSVLIIEDNKALLEELSESLEFSGFKTYESENGKAGIELAKSLCPDIILCDIMIPDADGFEVLKELKNYKSTSGIPFIFITSLNDRSSYRNGMDLGADDYLTKPFSEKELLNAVYARLKKHQELVSSKLPLNIDNTLQETITIMTEQINHQQKMLQQASSTRRSLSESLQKTEIELKEVIIKTIETTKTLEYLQTQLKDKLLSDNLPDQYHPIIRNMLFKINRIINKKDSLKDFQLKFNQIHPNVSRIILDKYPKLTQLDLTLISAIYLNLNTTQIASLLFISPDSVRKYRYRLKKKFNLSHEDSLYHFIQLFQNQYLKKD